MLGFGNKQILHERDEMANSTCHAIESTDANPISFVVAKHLKDLLESRPIHCLAGYAVVADRKDEFRIRQFEVATDAFTLHAD